MGLLDVALICRIHHKKGMIHFFDHDGVSTRSLADLLTSLGHIPSDLAVTDKDIDPETQCDTWNFVSCRADCRQGGLLECNHWLPAWTEEQLGAGWEVVRQSHVSKTYGAMHGAMTNIAHLTEAANPDNEALLESATEELEFLESLVYMAEQFAKSGLAIGDVPADGNCGAWTALCLRDMELSGEAPQHTLPQTLQLRKSLRDEWQVVQAHALWRQLFWSMDYHKELPAEVLAEAMPLRQQVPPAKQPRKPAEIDESEEKLSTPPKHRDPKKVNQCRPAAFGQKKVSEAVVLKRAGAPREQDVVVEYAPELQNADDEDDEDCPQPHLSKTQHPCRSIQFGRAYQEPYKMVGKLQGCQA